MSKEQRLVHYNFKLTQSEADVIRRKMQKLGMKNLSAYFRAMALNGHILKLDLPEIRELTRLLSNLTNNVNQITKRLNAHGSIYETELDEIQQSQKELWNMMHSILDKLDEATTRGGAYHD